MDLFKSADEKVEKKLIQQNEKDTKRSRSLRMSRHHKKYGTKKPEKRMNRHDIYVAWRDDL